MRYSSNTLRNSMEFGNTSSWVMTFESVGANSPNVNNLNLINNQFTPAMDVQYDHFNVKAINLEIGPGVVIEVPTYASQNPTTISVTCYDSHTKQIREALKDWVKTKLAITSGQAPKLDDLKNSCALLKIYHFDKSLNALTTDAFYVLPSGAFSYRGDQSFQADTLPLTFMVLGTQ